MGFPCYAKDKILQVERKTHAKVEDRGMQAKVQEALYTALLGKDDGGSGAGKSEDSAQNEKKMKMGTNDQ